MIITVLIVLLIVIAVVIYFFAKSNKSTETIKTTESTGVGNIASNANPNIIASILGLF